MVRRDGKVQEGAFHDNNIVGLMRFIDPQSELIDYHLSDIDGDQKAGLTFNFIFEEKARFDPLNLLADITSESIRK